MLRERRPKGERQIGLKKRQTIKAQRINDSKPNRKQRKGNNYK